MTSSFNPDEPGMVYRPGRPAGPAICPACGSPRTHVKNHGKRLGGALGTCAGVYSAVAGAKKGACVGALAGIRAIAPSAPLNSVTAAPMGALAGGAVGCAAGAALGQVIDETILNNHVCLVCGHTFQTL